MECSLRESDTIQPWPQQ